MVRPKNISDTQWNQALQLYETAKEKGDRYPELTVAQAALETGWFKSPSGKYNYFGQKASKNQPGTTLGTQEMAGNKAYSTQSKFRDYSNLGEAVDDRLRKWGSKYATANTIDEAIGKIWQYDPKTGQGKGYATDVNYGNKLKNILGSLGVASSQSNTPTQPSKTSYSPFENERKIFADIDLNAPQVGGQTFSEETSQEQENDGIAEAKALKEESFLKDFQDIQAQQAVEQEQAYQQQQEAAQPVMPQGIQPLEYQPIQMEFQDGGFIKDNRGQWAHPGQKTEIASSHITMQGVNYPVLGISKETGEQKMMMPNQNYFFDNTESVLEIPQFKNNNR